MRTSLLLLLIACSPDPAADASLQETGVHLDLPGHNDCLPEGQEMDDATCSAVIEADGRMPTVPTRAYHTVADDNDPRLDDPEYQWLEAEVKRCTCVCCHTERLGGPGTHRWDIDFAPVWIDSMNEWSMRVFVGDTYEGDQTLPTDDPDRLRAVLEAELALRDSNP
jgi:hypothetical protein